MANVSSICQGPPSGLFTCVISPGSLIAGTTKCVDVTLLLTDKHAKALEAGVETRRVSTYR